MDTTPELDGFLSSLLKDSRIPNIYDFYLPEDYSAVSMPSRFQKSAYSHPLILDTFGHVLSLCLVMFVVILFAALLKFSAIGCVQKVSQMILDKMIYNGIIRMILESCIYVFLGSFLNFKYGGSFDLHAIMNIFVSIGFILIMLIFAVNCYITIKRNHNEMSSDSCKKFNELTKEL